MIAFLVIGLAAGVLSGLFGIGGGILMIPACIWYFEMTQHQAQGTSLAALVLPVGLLAALQYYKQGNVHVLGALLLALGLTIGAYISASYVEKISELTLQRAFGVLLAIVAGQFLFARGDHHTAWGLAGLVGLLIGAKSARNRSRNS